MYAKSLIFYLKVNFKIIKLKAWYLNFVLSYKFN